MFKAKPAHNRRGFMLAGITGATAAAVGPATAAAPVQDEDPKQAIAEQLARYCRAWDRTDVELALSVWHPDGTAQYLDEPVSPVATMVPKRLDGRRASGMITSHQITNMLIEVKGDKATSEAYGTAWSQERTPEGDITQIHYFSRYLDSWSRRGGRWAIDHRRVVLDGYSQSSCKPLPALEKALGVGRKDREDPSYAHLAKLKT